MTNEQINQERRNFLGLAGKALGVGAIASISPSLAKACMDVNRPENAPTFWEALSPVIANPQIERNDADGLVYVKLSSDLETTTDLINNLWKYDLPSDEGKEIIYGTLDEARRNSNSATTYIAEVDLRGDFMPGEISGVYNAQTGDKLKMFRSRAVGGCGVTLVE